MLYMAKCYWPGVTENELRLAAARARDDGEGALFATYQSTLYLPGDELVLCRFDASSREAVKRAGERAGMPCERDQQALLAGAPTRLPLQVRPL